MKIEVTGCNNCPFRVEDSDYGKICAYNVNDKSGAGLIFTGNDGGNYRTNAPRNCHITLNGGTITVTTKSE